MLSFGHGVFSRQLSSTQNVREMSYVDIGLLFSFPVAISPHSGSWPPFKGVLRSNSLYTPHSVSPLDEWSAQRTDLYPKTHNTQNGHTTTAPAVFELSPSKRETADPHLKPLSHWDQHICCLHDQTGVEGGAVGWGTEPQGERSRVRFPKVSLT